MRPAHRAPYAVHLRRAARFALGITGLVLVQAGADPPPIDGEVVVQLFWEGTTPRLCFVNYGDEDAAVEIAARDERGIVLMATPVPAQEVGIVDASALAVGRDVEIRVAGRALGSFHVAPLPSGIEPSGWISVDDHCFAGRSEDWWLELGRLEAVGGDSIPVVFHLGPGCRRLALRAITVADRPAMVPIRASSGSLDIERSADDIHLVRRPGSAAPAAATVLFLAPEVSTPGMALFGGIQATSGGESGREVPTEWGFLRGLIVRPAPASAMAGPPVAAPEPVSSPAPTITPSHPDAVFDDRRDPSQDIP